ncbi:hypothetical protein QBC46DRAFT_388881 [Diplogelasinospora grovesii]|uniref:Extracellular membrane protein CFEM domain-containing protein n=1 Tax=Diplogelasinospora grovesii TaxID=303347 RepID=A0AAN6N5N6_9PEZI|nr:hypothetical protein QBC46DRAFT_388881 [Diplogelasinospora grovesii]
MAIFTTKRCSPTLTTLVWLSLVQGEVTITDTNVADGPLTCVGPVTATAFSQCDYMQSKLSACASTASARTARQDCLCNQILFNAIVDCESELQVCLQADGTDGTDGSLQAGVYSWHSLCDAYVSTSFTPTTPVLSSIGTSFDQFCVETAEPVCQSAKKSFDICTNSITNAAQISASCVCQPAFLSLDYTCEYLGNISCLATSATMSELIGYGCSNFAQVVGTAPVTPTSGSTVSLDIRTTQPTPGSSGGSGSGVATPTTSSRSLAAKTVTVGEPLGFLFGLAIAMFVL